MSKPTRRTRDMGNAVVRRTTMLVAAASLVGTGAFAAIQAKTYTAGHPTVATKLAGPVAATPGTSAKSHDSDDHDDHDEHDGHDGHDGTASQPAVSSTQTFSQPSSPPADASSSAGRVVSGGS